MVHCVSVTHHIPFLLASVETSSVCKVRKDFISLIHVNKGHLGHVESVLYSEEGELHTAIVNTSSPKTNSWMFLTCNYWLSKHKVYSAIGLLVPLAQLHTKLMPGSRRQELSPDQQSRG